VIGFGGAGERELPTFYVFSTLKSPNTYVPVSSMGQKWDEGVAFVRGINIYKGVRITRKKMLEICKKVESRNLEILRIFKTDNVIFKEAYTTQPLAQNSRRFSHRILGRKFM
jgi:hypothetical protein